MPRSSSGSAARDSNTRPGSKGVLMPTPAAGPMSLENFSLPGRPAGLMDPKARPSSRGGPGAGGEGGSGRPGTRSSLDSMRQGTRDPLVGGPERPSSRGGGAPRGGGAEQDGRPGTRGSGRPGAEAGQGKSWVPSLLGSPEPSGDRRPTSRLEDGRKGSSKHSSLRASKSTAPGKGQQRSPGKGAPAGGAANSDDEIERLVADAGGDADLDEADMAEFNDWLKEPEAPTRGHRRSKSNELQAKWSPSEGLPGTSTTEATGIPKKKRSKEESELKRGQIVDFYVDRMVRDLEKEVSASPTDYYAVQLYCRKPLKEALNAIETAFEKAWAIIDLELKIAEVEKIEQSTELEVEEWMAGGQGDWQDRVRQETGSVDMDHLLRGIPAAVSPARLAALPPAALEPVVDLDDISSIPRPEDPLDALMAADLLTRRPPLKNTLIKMDVAPDTSAKSSASRSSMPSSKKPFNPAMAQYAMRSGLR
mmetsp:Transcript_23769/g.65939  ORF Transcript_23769/g.65939 Transcript_23769/m.65939 type:complete len:477 (+) Transcript_23769:87-1517(+)